MSDRFNRVCHPGKYIKEDLEDLNMSIKEFSLRAGISERTLSDLLAGKGNMTFNIAKKLEDYFNISAETWMALQTAYDNYLCEEENNIERENDYNAIKKYKAYLIDNNLINGNESNEEMVDSVRRNICVNQLCALYNCDFGVVYKEQKNQKGDPFAKNFWIAYALTEARKIETPPFNKNELFMSIKEIRRLTTLSPKDFIPRLKEIFTRCGISFVYIPYLKQSNIYGATKWLSSDKVMLAISNRNERADVFWFTLFHEMAHVIFEHKRYYLFQGADIKDERADVLAQDFLIDNIRYQEFVKRNVFSEASISIFAKEEGILPMIVIGRLQKDGYVSYNKSFPNLYAKYDESDLRDSFRKVQ